MFQMTDNITDMATSFYQYRHMTALALVKLKSILKNMLNTPH